MMCYIEHATEYRLVGQVAGSPHLLKLKLFVDADFAGCRLTAKSTNRGYLVLTGPNTFFPLQWVSRKQTSVSRSTAESEVVSLAISVS